MLASCFQNAQDLSELLGWGHFTEEQEGTMAPHAPSWVSFSPLPTSGQGLLLVSVTAGHWGHSPPPAPHSQLAPGKVVSLSAFWTVRTLKGDFAWRKAWQWPEGKRTAARMSAMSELDESASKPWGGAAGICTSEQSWLGVSQESNGEGRETQRTDCVLKFTFIHPPLLLFLFHLLLFLLPLHHYYHHH